MSSVRRRGPDRGADRPAGRDSGRDHFGATLAVTTTLSFATVLALMAVQLLVIHPDALGTGRYAGLINQQNQTVKTDLYVGAFVVILPLALLAAGKLVDSIAAGPNAIALPAFAAVLSGTLAAVVVGVRLSGALPWGDGVRGILIGVAAWSLAAAAVTWRSARGGRWPALHRLAQSTPVPVAIAALLTFATLLCVTSGASLSATPLLLGSAISVGVLVAHERIALHAPRRWVWPAELIVIVLLALAIPDVVVFHDPTGAPSIYSDPGIVQFQHDYILGPVNQLLGGGALLVNDPVSQYGVGLIYFVAGWFHIAPIGYGTFGLLDSLLTALFYIAGYMVLRLAGAGRLLAGAAIAAGVLAFVYHFGYYLGQLPEEGPLRFGLPMVVLLGAVIAQLGFALATVAGSGRLPDWGQYLAYAREFLLGGGAASITYGFADWSPALAVDGAALISAAAIVLLMRRKPLLARAHPARLVALVGSTAYAIAILSYTDNRSSTYLLLYVALPLLIAGSLWLALVLAPGSRLPRSAQRGGLATALAIVTLLLAGAWPSIGAHLSRTALAHAYPGGGLSAALHRLWHPPAIDPRAPEGIRLLQRDMPARRSVILVATSPDLGTEILVRSHRSNRLPIGDPKADGLVTSVWLPRIRAAVAQLRAGDRILIDATALNMIAALRRRADLVNSPIQGGSVEVEWILRELDRRFAIRPVDRAADGLIVAALGAH